jgi:hypothetical protein
MRPIAQLYRQSAALPRLRQRLRRLAQPAWLGTLRRTDPLSASWGRDRGTPVDRYYIEHFLEAHRQDIRGRVLEVRDSTYTGRYGGELARRDVLDIDPSNRCATIVADLAAAHGIRADQFDCFILTQTLQFIYDVRAALQHARRILRPGATLLATLPAISRVDRRQSGDYWRFTAASCARLFGEVFGEQHVQVQSYGNVLAAIAFLAGMAHEELSRRELMAYDEFFPVIITVRARKPAEAE